MLDQRLRDSTIVRTATYYTDTDSLSDSYDVTQDAEHLIDG